MKRKNRRGVAIVEFTFVSLVLVPLFLGTGAIGINMIRTLQTIQLARDAGSMFARGADFGTPGGKTILAKLGADLGLSATAGQGSAVVILSALTYVDVAACKLGGAVDINGNPSGCTNLNKWVFKQRLVIGKPSVRASNMGSPLTSGPNGVTVDPNTGKITPQDYVTKSGAVVNFTLINPYSIVTVNGVSSAQGLPSGESIYVSEAAALAFVLPPFAGATSTYSFGYF